MWSLDPDDGTPWVAIGDMSSGRLVTTTDRRISPIGIESKRLTVAEAGTVLFAMYASVGAVATLGIPATWNQAILGIRPLPGRSDRRFLAYWLQYIAPQARALVRASTQDNLNAEQVANSRSPSWQLILSGGLLTSSTTRSPALTTSSTHGERRWR
jgi:type I restriction enzyme S subunit